MTMITTTTSATTHDAYCVCECVCVHNSTLHSGRGKISSAREMWYERRGGGSEPAHTEKEPDKEWNMRKRAENEWKKKENNFIDIQARFYSRFQWQMIMIDWTYMPIAIRSLLFSANSFATVLHTFFSSLLVLHNQFLLYIGLCGDTNSDWCDALIFTNEYTSSSSPSSLLLLWLAALADFYGALSIIKHINIPNTADRMPIILSFIVSERASECVLVIWISMYVAMHRHSSNKPINCRNFSPSLSHSISVVWCRCALSVVHTVVSAVVLLSIPNQINSHHTNVSTK